MNNPCEHVKSTNDLIFDPSSWWQCKVCNTLYSMDYFYKLRSSETIPVEKQNELIIVYGPPGASKTTTAKKIANKVFETDNYWLNCVGDYLFVQSKLGTAHKWCQSEVEKAMQDGISSIAVSNTNLTNKERQPYVDLAKKYNYKIIYAHPRAPWYTEMRPRLVDKTFTEEDVQTLFNKNIHNVPIDVLRNMMQRYEEPDK